MTYEEAIERVRKLQALATSDNPNEAALAAMRMQEIMTRFAIDQASIDEVSAHPDEQEEEDFAAFRDDPLDRNDNKSQLPTWRWRLGDQLAGLNGCGTYITQGKLGIYGRPSGVGTVRYMYAWLTREVERITLKHCKGNGRTYTNNFRNGCVDTINRKLREASTNVIANAKREAEKAPTSTALVRLNTALAKLEANKVALKEFGKKELRLRSRGGGGTGSFDRNARDAGRKAGEAINVGGVRPALGAGQRALTS